MPVSLTRSGIPRIIPTFHRRIIRVRDERADRVVQLYLSWFSLGSRIRLSKKQTFPERFKSMLKFPTQLQTLPVILNELDVKLRDLLERYMPSIEFHIAFRKARGSRPSPIIDRRGGLIILVPALIAVIVSDELGEGEDDY